ncbi:hypothetical protein COU77_03895 [Candidatus Peregrinibacteria bacterium CG10_big_fil_rev_8_21_14_0_10_49_16]|nr:MAG: hypothetical protein COU77_03895 [Candidatus Peregrinibacteria bacterium CG10_big_fil_rev_8_21_14_0_10_49_16]
MDSHFNQRSFASTANQVKSFTRKNKFALLIAALVLIVVYWQAIRPIRVNAQCTSEASHNSRILLKNKAESTTDWKQKEEYENLIKKNMYLRSDYEAYYKRCLRGHGIFL